MLELCISSEKEIYYPLSLKKGMQVVRGQVIECSRCNENSWRAMTDDDDPYRLLLFCNRCNNVEVFEIEDIEE